MPKILVKSAIVLSLVLSAAFAQAAVTPGYNVQVPEEIMTPDTVETRIGTMNFYDGVPTAETVKTVYDHLDFLRGVDVFLNFIPACSIEGMRRGNISLGVKDYNEVLLMDELMDSKPLFLTGNTDTVYASSFMSLLIYYQHVDTPHRIQHNASDTSTIYCVQNLKNRLIQQPHLLICQKPDPLSLRSLKVPDPVPLTMLFSAL